MAAKRKNLQKPGRSRQDYQTPLELLDAIEERFGSITWDAAASSDNSVVEEPGRFFSAEGISAFDADWSKYFTPHDLIWCNPPFGTIQYEWAPLIERWTSQLPWLRVLFFTPAALGSEWYREHIHGKANVLVLNPRITFVGEPATYPKDTMLSVFGYGLHGFDVYRWCPTRAEKSAIRKAAKVLAKARAALK